MSTMHTLKIGNLTVELDALAGIRHRFDPDKCSKGGCCCSSYEIAMGSREADRITNWIPLAGKYAPGLLDEEGEPDNPFDEEDGVWVIDTNMQGRCAFAYKNRQGRILCSIHSAALDQGEDPYKIKPRCCTLWPLAISEGRNKVLGVADDAFDFPCNRRRRPRKEGTLDEGVAEIVRTLFGAPFLRKVEQALAGP